jgi:hypothetical protein
MVIPGFPTFPTSRLIVALWSASNGSQSKVEAMYIEFPEDIAITAESPSGSISQLLPSSSIARHANFAA